MNGYLNRLCYRTIGSFNFLDHSLKPKAFPNQDRERGRRDGTEGGSGAQTKKTKKRGDTQSNTTLVLQVHSGEKKMRDKYKHGNKQSARLAVLTANNKINLQRKMDGCKDRQEDVRKESSGGKNT